MLPQLISANHLSEKEINNNLKELDSYLQSGEMTEEDYQTKKDWLYQPHNEQDLNNSDKDLNRSTFWTYLVTPISITLIIFGIMYFYKK